jgi:ATP-dependent DNA ligase
MHLPVNPPVLPMLAKVVVKPPDGDGWIFEPKWDGFRALVFRDGDEVFIQSRDAKPLVRLPRGNQDEAHTTIRMRGDDAPMREHAVWQSRTTG